MPELPEVECVRRGLSALVGARVERAKLYRRDMLVVPGDPPAGWSRSGATAAPKRVTRAHLLVGATIAAVTRHGKQLALHADDGRTIAAHLGMTGAFTLFDPTHTDPTQTDPAHSGSADAQAAPRTHLHAAWWFASGVQLAFTDPRRFGGLWSYPSRPAFERERLTALGPDALGLTPGELAHACAGRRTSTKAVLLDQRRVAGVGNIYADEALFRARVSPERAAGSLTPAQTRLLAGEIRRVLASAIKGGGSTLRDYRDTSGRAGTYASRHLVYGRGGLACTRCQGTLTTGTIAQRTTVWCPSCQT